MRKLLVLACGIGALVTPAARAAAKVTAQPLGNPVWNVFEGVSCSSADACTAVGSSSVLTLRLATKSSATLVERWNGRTWVLQRTPSRALSELTAVSCSSPNACTAVGEYSNRTGRAVTLAERWNGKSWRIQHTPNPATGGGESIFYGVSCPSSHTCVAVGYYRSLAPGQIGSFPLVERWNGSRWAIQSTPTPSGSGFDVLSAVSCSSPRGCTAVGSYAPNASSIGTALAERWDGHSWTIQTTPSPSNSSLAAVSCSSADTCTAAGRVALSATLAERWDGQSWTVQATPNPAKAWATNLSGVSCSAAQRCTTAGFSLSGPVTVAERWNGTRWAIQRTFNPGVPGEADLNGVSCSAPNACTAVGTYFAGGNKHTLVERWNGRRWALQPTPS